MKKFIFGLVLVLAGAFFANAQTLTLTLTPLSTGGYVQHFDVDKTANVSMIPEWVKTKKPSYSSMWQPYMMSMVRQDSNWVKLNAESFAKGSVFGECSVSKDDAGRLWVLYRKTSSKSPVLLALIDLDAGSINTLDDVFGEYWVSWKLIDGTKDIYPILHKE